MKKKFKNVAINIDVHRLISVHAAKLDVKINQYVSDAMLLVVRSKLEIPKKTAGLRIKFVEKEER